MSMTESEAIRIVVGYAIMEAENLPLLVARAFDVLKDATKEAREYRAIGTVEDIKKVISFLSSDSDNSITDDLNLLNEYRFIGTVSEFRELKEKATAKKPTYQGTHAKCPSCFSFHVYEDYCSKCGQMIDWSEGKE